MNIFHFLCAAITVTFTCVSCVSSNTLSAETLRKNPLPIPEFVSTLTTQVRKNSRYCGVTIKDGVIWRQGDNADSLRQNIERTTRITLDSQNMGDLLFPHDMLSPISEYDSSGNLLGSHGSDTSICFEVASAALGWHIATIEVKATNGDMYSHTWAIEVVDKLIQSTPASP